MRISQTTFRLLMAVLLVVGLTGCADQLTGTNEADTRSAPSEPVAQLAEDNEATAQVQVIHNADDPKARVVDVYVNGMLALDDFEYRTATEFLMLPTDVEVAVAPADSRSVDDAIATFFEDTTLEEDQQYIVVADGVLPGFLDKPPFEENPEGIDIAFNLYPYAPAKTEAANPGTVDLLAFHGATDAPTVDVAVQGGPTLVDDISYGSFQGYVEGVAPAEYVLDVTTADGSTTVASFEANLSELGGSALTVVASGFLTPPPGPKFGLLAVTADGTVLELPRVDDEGDDDEGEEDAKVYEAELEGENEVPDAVETDAEGEAKFQYIPARNELRYKVKLEDIEDVTQAHIHLGAPDENGPVIAFLLKFADSVTGPEEDAVTPRGALVEQGTITADDVIALDGFDGSLESLIAEMDAGNTYVNVHTVENPAGEVRGQIVLDDDEGDD